MKAFCAGTPVESAILVKGGFYRLTGFPGPPSSVKVVISRAGAHTVTT